MESLHLEDRSTSPNDMGSFSTGTSFATFTHTSKWAGHLIDLPAFGHLPLHGPNAGEIDDRRGLNFGSIAGEINWA